MGIFDIFKKRKKSLVEKRNNPAIVQVTSQSLDPSNYYSIHPDIKELIWIENGPKKNFVSDKVKGQTYNINGLTISVSISGREEPSLIDMNQEIIVPTKRIEVPSPSYYPNYKDLTPEQKSKYWEVLSNPYQPELNISYVFILYYGLERHLFMHNFIDAIKVIIKLREVHKGSSFQTYSGNAIVLSCLLHQRADMMDMFLKSLDEEYKRGFSESLYLLGIYSFDKPFTSEDIMRLCKTFSFTNTNYVKGYPEIFKKTLEDYLIINYSSKSVLLKEIVPSIEELPEKEMRLFANMSLNEESVSVPDLVASEELQQAMNNLLIETHESVKKQLAEMRKKNVVPRKKENKKPKKMLKFDAKEELRLLHELKKSGDPIKKHFTYIQLQDFYYKYRDIAPAYLQECIKYCYEDLEMLDQLNKAYINQEVRQLKRLETVYSKEQLNNKIKKIQKERFQGRIPAFSRLAIIYEKRKEYGFALNIANKAIDYYKKQGMNTSEFENRIERIQKKVKG
ncbi:hypothetical protein A6P54_17895 [Bacillus sp. MKU004]|nr:hypothetical protein A6P54_17895 [Bacillus sp. MKU004]